MAKERYHYRECGLDDVYLHNGFRFEFGPRGRILIVEDLDGLHRAIGRYLVLRKKRLSGSELRFLRRELGFGQRELGNLIGKTEQTVARWEKEQSRIDGPAERLLRLLYCEHAGETPSVGPALDALARLEEPSGAVLSLLETKHGWRARQPAA